MNESSLDPFIAKVQKFLDEQDMHDMLDLREQAIKDQEMKYPSPLPLWRTPLYLQLLGYPKWRFKTPALTWHYLPNSEYIRLFSQDI